MQPHPDESSSIRAHVFTGSELSRRVCGPEHLRDPVMLSTLMGPSFSVDGNQIEKINRFIEILSSKSEQSQPIYSAFTCLHEGKFIHCLNMRINQNFTFLK